MAAGDWEGGGGTSVQVSCGVLAGQHGLPPGRSSKDQADPCRGSCPAGVRRAFRAVRHSAGYSGSASCPPPQGTGGSWAAAGAPPAGDPGGSGDS